MNDSDLRRGDIVLVAFPYTDLSLQKRRPALVLNQYTAQGDVILAFISTQVPSQLTPTSVRLDDSDADFQQTGLKTNSIIQLDKIVTIERLLITRRLGKLGKSKLEAIDHALIKAIGISYFPAGN